MTQCGLKMCPRIGGAFDIVSPISKSGRRGCGHVPLPPRIDAHTVTKDCYDLLTFHAFTRSAGISDTFDRFSTAGLLFNIGCFDRIQSSHNIHNYILICQSYPYFSYFLNVFFYKHLILFVNIYPI